MVSSCSQGLRLAADEIIGISRGFGRKNNKRDPGKLRARNPHSAGRGHIDPGLELKKCESLHEYSQQATQTSESQNPYLHGGSHHTCPEDQVSLGTGEVAQQARVLVTEV